MNFGTYMTLELVKYLQGFEDQLTDFPVMTKLTLNLYSVLVSPF